jgi:hypothetical protein
VAVGQTPLFKASIGLGFDVSKWPTCLRATGTLTV